MIHTGTSLVHWNYFIAIESDLERVARFIEFTEKNFDVYSIELAHLLLAAASEIDTLAKLICEYSDPGGSFKNIGDYKTTITAKLPNFSTTPVFVPRYGLTLNPWDNWAKNIGSPDWWTGYNQVKHKRDAHFEKATLQNALNAVGALLIVNFYYHSYFLAPSGSGSFLTPKDTTQKLDPTSSLLRLPDDFYRGSYLQP